MRKQRIITVGGVIAALTIAGSAAAQDAAETAVILSGSSGHGKASNSLGNAVRGSINSAASAVRSAPKRSNANTSRRNAHRGPVQIQTIPSNDPLEDTDASRFTTSSGATISVSGRMRPSASARCVENCATPDQASEAQDAKQPAPE